MAFYKKITEWGWMADGPGFIVLSPKRSDSIELPKLFAGRKAK
jgi:hypothetical protein